MLKERELYVGIKQLFGETINLQIYNKNLVSISEYLDDLKELFMKCLEKGYIKMQTVEISLSK